MIEKAINFYFAVQGLVGAGYQIHFKKNDMGKVVVTLVRPGQKLDLDAAYVEGDIGTAANALEMAMLYQQYE